MPQFIEIEDHVVGPLTLKQFLYVAGGAGICIVFFVYLPFIYAFILSAPIVGLVVALAFYRVNGKPFIEVLEAGFNYYTGAKLFLWRHEQKTAVSQQSPEPVARAPKVARLTTGKLSELAWSLDVQGRSGNDDERES